MGASAGILFYTRSLAFQNTEIPGGSQAQFLKPKCKDIFRRFHF